MFSSVLVACLESDDDGFMIMDVCFCSICSSTKRVHPVDVHHPTIDHPAPCFSCHNPPRHTSSARRLFELSLAVGRYHVDGFKASGAVHTLFIFAHCEWRGSNITQASSLLRRALAADPSNVQSLALSGILASEAGDAERARTCFHRALEVDAAHQVTLQV